jgi:hypothetical protein
MCWSKHEREQWERERRAAEEEAERIRLVSKTEPAAEPEPVAESDEREEELVRAEVYCGRPLRGGRPLHIIRQRGQLKTTRRSLASEQPPCR